MVISIYKPPEDGKTWAEQKCGDICDVISYEYEKYFNGVGTFTLELPVNTRFRAELLVNRVLVTDSGDALIIRYIQTTLERIKVTGYDLNGLLCDRVTLGTDEGGYDPCEGSTEYCVKYYVSNNLVSSAVPQRNLPRFDIVGNALDRGIAADHAYPRYQNLQELVTEMCAPAKLGWRVSIDTKSAGDKPVFLFDVYEQTDRSVNQSERDRVIFSAQTHNVSGMTREVGVTSAKNTLYLDIDGTVVQYPREPEEDSADTAQRVPGAGYDRREEYCSLSGKSLEEDIYKVEAEQNMADRMQETDSLTIDAGSPLDYGTRYDVGTVVTVFDRERSLQLDSVISAVTVKRTAEEYSVKLTLGESKPKLLDLYQKKSDSTSKTVRTENGARSSDYISAKVSNSQAISYDGIERGLLSVDFTVDGTDSDVVFSANQLCDVGAAGTLNCIYKVDGATQDFKPAQSLAAGQHVLPHYYAMPLDKGKHNFAIYILSPDGGSGTTNIGGLIGALSGQISGLKNNAPPNENLILYFEGVPADTEITLPKYMYYDSSVQKYVDWGDGSAVEESTAISEVSHTYTSAGNYTVTIKSNAVNFGAASYKPSFSDNFNQYIKRIYFPDGAKEIRWSGSTSAFPNLETLVFGKSATYILWDFKASTEITSLLIPETAISVYLSSFRNTNVSSLVIPQNVTSLNGGSILANCPSLTSFEVYSGAPSIGAPNSVNLRSLTIGGNATRIYAYYGCTSLSSVNFTSPSKIKEVWGSAFKECTSLTSINLPQTVETIGVNAFYGCTGLASISMPEKLTVIDQSTFYGCKALSSVHVGANVSEIKVNAFYNCTSLSDINFPDGLTTIGQSAFQNTGSISPTFPASLKTIGVSAFNGSGITGAVLHSNTVCGINTFKGSGLRSLTIEDGFGTIPEQCFMDTTALVSVDIPGSVEIISKQAFDGSGVKNLTLAEGVRSIGQYAFQESGVTSLVVPETVTDIGYHAFYNCDNLSTVSFRGNTSLGSNVFSNCDGLISVDMGKTNIIPSGCFSSCDNLGSVSFALDTSIGGSAFAGCGFKSLDILGCLQKTDTLSEYGGMYNIGQQAFKNCTSLTSVDGYEYKWDVGLKRTDIYKDENGNSYSVVTDLGLQVEGIYDTMGATSDSVFSGTGLKAVSDYPKPANTSTTTYSVYHYTGRNPAYTS